MNKALVICVLTLFMAPGLIVAVPDSGAKEDRVTVEVFDFLTNSCRVQEMTQKEAEALETELFAGDTERLGLKFDVGFTNYVLSYGRGDVFIPLGKERSFFRFVWKPILFNFEHGVTLVKFGANYEWKGHGIGDFGVMLNKQCGLMAGFFGLHVRIPWQLRPDTHIFMGGTLFMLGYNRAF